MKQSGSTCSHNQFSYNKWFIDRVQTLKLKGHTIIIKRINSTRDNCKEWKILLFMNSSLPNPCAESNKQFYGTGVWEQLQNTPQLIYMSLNNNSVYCVMPRSSKPPDTCKWGGPKLRGIVEKSIYGPKTLFTVSSRYSLFRFKGWTFLETQNCTIT